MTRFLAELRFWCAFVWETATRRRLRAVIRSRLRGVRVDVRGTESVPASGPFVMAINHYRDSATFHVFCAVLQSLGGVRPDVPCDALIVAGRREPSARRGWMGAGARRLADAILGRWSAHLVRIPLGNAVPDLRALRVFLGRAAQQPTIVFPEGRASAELGDVRDGAGRFLSLVPVPTLPVAVHEEGGAWVVTFGTAIAWSRRKELRDVQLGMAIADLLPAHVAPDWQRLLADWRGAHAQSHRSIGCRS